MAHACNEGQLQSHRLPDALHQDIAHIVGHFPDSNSAETLVYDKLAFGSKGLENCIRFTFST